MSQEKIYYLIIILIVLLSFSCSNTVLLGNDIFSVDKTEVDITTELNQSAKFEITITNNSENSQSFYLGKDYFDEYIDIINDGNVELKPKQSKKVTLEIVPKKQGIVTRFMSIITQESKNSISKKIQINITITKPSNFQVSYNDNIVLGLTETNNCQIKITNNGNYDDIFEIDASSDTLDVILNKSALSILSKSYEIVTMTVKLKGCNCGTVKFAVTSRNDNVKKDFTLQINPKSSHFGVETKTHLNITMTESLRQDIIIRNLGENDDVFTIDLSTDNVDCSISKSSVNIASGGCETINLTSFLQSENLGKVTLIVTSKNDGSKEEISIIYELNKADFEIETQECIYTKNQESQIEITVENKTDCDDTINIRIENIPSYVTMNLTSTSIRVSANSKMKISLPFIVTIDRDETTKLDLVAVSSNNINVQKTQKIELTDLNGKLLSAINNPEVYNILDLRTEGQALVNAFRGEKYEEVEEVAMSMLTKMADYAGISTEKQIEEPYVVDIEEPTEIIKIDNNILCNTENIGEKKQLQKERVKKGLHEKGWGKEYKNMYRNDSGTFFVVDKDGNPYVPNKDFFEVVELLDENNENQTQVYTEEVFRYYKKNWEFFYTEDSLDLSALLKWDQFWDLYLNGRYRDDYDDKKEVDIEYDSIGKVKNSTYICYKAKKAKKVMVVSEADSATEFLKAGNAPTKRIVIFTHGTLMFKWVENGYQHGDTYLYTEDGKPDTMAVLKSMAPLLDVDLNNDKIYNFNWSGDNDYQVREKAGKSLVNFIYNKVSDNLYYNNATQVILIGHSHGVTVNNIAMININAEKLAKFGAEIPFVIGLNGIGKSYNEYDLATKNEKSNRSCYEFPDVEFKSLGGDCKTKMYNFYVDSDGVVPPGFDDEIVFPFNNESEYIAYMALYFNPLTYLVANVFAMVQSVKFIAMYIMARVHNDNRKEALKISNATNIEMSSFVSQNSQEFYDRYIRGSTVFSSNVYQNIFTSLFYLDIRILPYVFLNLQTVFTSLSINGDATNKNYTVDFFPHHQLARMSFNFEKCLSKIDSNLISDKTVDF